MSRPAQQGWAQVYFLWTRKHTAYIYAVYIHMLTLYTYKDEQPDHVSGLAKLILLTCSELQFFMRGIAVQKV